MMSNPATRLIHLILLLQSKPNHKVAGLASELGVSVRTVHRYFGMLEDMGIPLYSERGRYGGFALVRGYKLPPLVFTPDEAVILNLGAGLVEQMWGDLYRDAARSSLAKLDNLLPEEQRREVAWAQRTLISAGLNRLDAEQVTAMLTVFRKALKENCQVNITYRGQNRGETTQRKVDPYAIVHQAGWWSVVGYCHLRKNIRLFRVDRILKLSLLKQTYTISEDFDVHAYLAHQIPPQPQRLARIHFDREAESFVRKSGILWSSIEQLSDGSLITTLSVDDMHFAASLVLSFGPWAEVLEPEELRSVITEWATASLEKHRPKSI